MGIYGINEKLIKKEAPKFGSLVTRYKISLPIGEESDKWGTFYTSAANIASVGAVPCSVLLPINEKNEESKVAGKEEEDLDL